ncbi:hypothetical protein WCD74_00525 [Actinomycetospora sp. OC33-EN08]|uniref:Polysaccharide biosynthesis protein n=1 Tax=Actinomycetospora aurantiaca TaxID=3129233 RepID=A0ABU8MGX0_9PSEU
MIGLADQLLSSGTNFVFVFVVARTLDEHEFGVFVIGMSLTLFVAGVQRAFIGEPLLSLVSTIRDTAHRNDMIHAAVVLAFLAGVAALGVISLVSVITHDSVAALWYTAICLPFLLVQDACRYAALAIHRQSAALLSDGVWFLVQFGSMAVLVTAGVDGPLALAGTWTAGAAVAMLVLLRSLGVELGRRPVLGAWWSLSRTVSGWRTATSIAGQFQQQGIVVLVGVLLTPTAAGGLRIAQLLVAQPVTTVAAAVVTILIPLTARLHADGDGPETARMLVRVEIVAGVAAVAVAMLAWERTDLMRLVFPAYLDQADLLIPICLQAACVCLSSPLQAVARGRRRLKPLFVGQIACALVAIATTALGARSHGAEGAAWGLTAGAFAFLVTSVIACRGMSSPMRVPSHDRKEEDGCRT